MALLILKIRMTSVFSGETHPERIKNQTDYWLIIMITQVWNFQLAPNIIAELRPTTR